jgi:hypothetical protein
MARPRAAPPAPAPVRAQAQALAVDIAVAADRVGPEESPTPRPTLTDDRTFLRRLRSSVALLIVLTFVGATVALLIGIAMFLATMAIENTVN